MTSMKAVRIHSYGGLETLAYEDAPRPAPQSGEVLIRIHATTVNPFDLAKRAGYMANFFPASFPLILGTDVSGEIAELGPGVTGFAVGDQVYARAGVHRDGAYAEYAAVAATDVAIKPRSIDHIHAAALPHVVLTAWQALYTAAELSAGQTVLIHGAAGGVGHIAVQLAKLRGAQVIGTASARNQAFLKQLGVDVAIDYASTPFESIAKNVDVVLDTQGGDTQERSWGTLKPGGMLVSVIQPPSDEIASAYGVRTHFVYACPPIGQTLKEVAALVDSGVLKPEVSMILPLQSIGRAHETLQARHMRGKLVLQVSQ